MMMIFLLFAVMMEKPKHAWILYAIGSGPTWYSLYKIYKAKEIFDSGMIVLTWDLGSILPIALSIIAAIIIIIRQILYTKKYKRMRADKEKKPSYFDRNDQKQNEQS